MATVTNTNSPTMAAAVVDLPGDVLDFRGKEIARPDVQLPG